MNQQSEKSPPENRIGRFKLIHLRITNFVAKKRFVRYHLDRMSRATTYGIVEDEIFVRAFRKFMRKIYPGDWKTLAYLNNYETCREYIRKPDLNEEDSFEAIYEACISYAWKNRLLNTFVIEDHDIWKIQIKEIIWEMGNEWLFQLQTSSEFGGFRWQTMHGLQLIKNILHEIYEEIFIFKKSLNDNTDSK